jgi:hypothetical protein
LALVAGYKIPTIYPDRAYVVAGGLAENLVTLDAIKQAGGNARGVAIINPTIWAGDLSLAFA